MSAEQGPGDFFEREFLPTDRDLFRELTIGMIGLPLARSRRTYADGLVLEFGQLVHRDVPSEKLPGERGEWVVSDWGGDPIIRLGSAGVVDSRVDGAPAVEARLQGMARDAVADIMLSEPDLSLEIEFTTGHVFSIVASRSDPDLDQWYIICPDGASLGVTGRGTWYRRAG